MNEDEGPFLLVLIGVTNTIGRVICGWIADRPWTSSLQLNNGSLIVAGITTMLCALGYDYWHLRLYAACFGFCVGEWCVACNLLTTRYYKHQDRACTRVTY